MIRNCVKEKWAAGADEQLELEKPAKSSADVTSEVQWVAFRKRTGLKAGKIRTCNG